MQEYRAAFAALSATELPIPVQHDYRNPHKNNTGTIGYYRPCTRHKISAMRDCERSQFWRLRRLCRHERELERNRSWLPVDRCIMSSASSISLKSKRESILKVPYALPHTILLPYVLHAVHMLPPMEWTNDLWASCFRFESRVVNLSFTLARPAANYKHFIFFFNDP